MPRSYVYIMASKQNGTLYIGVTSDLIKRVYDHKNDMTEGFTKTYGVHHLVWFEEYGDIRLAIAKEKQMEKWKRNWKIKLIEQSNPGWRDLYDSLFG